MRTTIAFLLLYCLRSQAQAPFDQGRITASPDGHYLQHANGQPFFWLGDTAWELFHRLTLKEIIQYLDNRKSKGFNVIQAVVLAEFNGLTIPNRNGALPLINQNPETPNEGYFRFIDTVVTLARSRGMYIGLLPTWGDKVTLLWGTGPAVFTQDNAYKYGSWIGRRYKESPNVLWILGGDRPAVKDSSDWRPIWRAMAGGILDATGRSAFITYHPSGSTSSSQYLHQESWLDMNMIQSGHGSGHDVPVWEQIARDIALLPHKPVLDAEPNYEDHPVNPWPVWDPASGYYRDYDVRKQLYRSVFAGACGVTYGHHSIWQFYSPREEKINHADRYWTEALDRPGAYQAGYLIRLMQQRPSLKRIPDEGLIRAGQGEKENHACAFRDSSGSYLMVYMPVGRKIIVNTTVMPAERLNAWWYNPRTGTSLLIKAGIKRETHMNFTPPATGPGNDWVLVLDDTRYTYTFPTFMIHQQAS